MKPLNVSKMSEKASILTEYNLVGKFTIDSTDSNWKFSHDEVYMSLIDYTNPETKEFSLKIVVQV